MTTTLFRTIHPDRQAIPGLLDLRSPTLAILTAFLAGSVVLAAVFIGVMPYARRQPAIGFVVPDAGTVRVMAPQSGTLRQVFVTDGMLVDAGTPLFSLGYGRSLEDGASLQANLSLALDRQEALLKEQIAADALRLDHEQAGLDSRLEGLEAERTGLRDQAALLDQRVRVANEQFQSGDNLRQRSVITDTDLRAREDAWLARRQELATVDQRLNSITHEKRQIEFQRAQSPADSRDRIARLDGAVAALRQQKAEAEANDGAIVRAPVAGRVSALQAAVGQQIDAAKPVLSLVPANVSMHAELFVPPQAIGSVEPGQRVRLTYDAFPFQRFGAQGGVIDHMSQTMLAPDDVAGPVRPPGPAYLVTVRLDTQRVMDGERAQMLRADMTLQAEIVLERRTVLDWMLGPLMEMVARARS